MKNSKNENNVMCEWYDNLDIDHAVNLREKYGFNANRPITDSEIGYIWRKEFMNKLNANNSSINSIDGGWGSLTREQIRIITSHNESINNELNIDVDSLSDNDKIRLIESLDKSLHESYIKKISERFALKCQKNAEGFVDGWWKFVKEQYPNIYRI